MAHQMTALKSIRLWDGSQHRAFEELCYQLLRDVDVPQHAGLPIRTGNPDGGVEWYVDLSDRTQWGWQAKYIDDIDTLLKAMDKTVERIVRDRPALTRLTFCIPTNLSAGTAGRTRQSQRQKYEARVERWHEKEPGAENIDFHLIQESDLLERLALPAHAGRRLFWFNEAILGPEQLTRIHERQSQVAGRRYRPDLQVDLPIEDDLRALGFSDHFFAQLDAEEQSVSRQLRYLRGVDGAAGVDIAAAFGEAVVASNALRDTFNSFVPSPADADPLATLENTAQQAEKALTKARDLAFEFERKSDRAEDPVLKALAEQVRTAGYHARQLLGAVWSLVEFLDSPAARALRRRAYFLTGGAGTGTTHLLLDSGLKALEEGRPAAVIFGSRFGDDDLWATISTELGLGHASVDELFGALTACAQASSLSGRRFLLAIDALNETTDETFWQRNLTTFRATVEQWPHVAVAVSCRDTYLDAVDPETRRATEFAERAHPGFTGREIESTHKYFRHHDLTEPRIPLLLPEFTVPLFLQLYCESLRATGRDAPPDHHESRVEIFARFVDTKVGQVAIRLAKGGPALKRQVIEQDVRDTLGAFVDECIRAGREGVRRARLLAISPEPKGPGVTAVEIYGTLISEGVLTEDRLYIDGKYVPAIRFTFQAFADYMILQRRIGSESVADDDIFREWLFRASYGVVEAAAVVLPHRFDIEMPDYLEPLVERAAAEADEGGLRRRHEMRWLDEIFIRTLPYRSGRSITDRTITLLNRYLEGDGDGAAFFDVFFALAPQPDHRLNGDGLHWYLMRQKMPDRDAWFGQSTYFALDEDGAGAAVRLARWAARGPYHDYDPDVVELAAIPLVWLFSSPNRFMRDWVTKALVQLLRGHLDVLVRLLNRFAGVDDPYVWERLVTVAYGCVMRAADSRQAETFRPLVEFASTEIFEQLDRFVPDALMLDAARGIVEWGAATGLADEEALARARGRYGFSRPKRAWTKKTIDEKYDEPYRDSKRDDGYHDIYFSMFSMGDFGRYVVQSGLDHFSRTPLEEPPPTRDDPPNQPPRLNKKRWARFERTLTTEQLAALAALAVAKGEGGDVSQRFFDSLTDDQRVLFRDVWTRPRALRRWRDTSYSSEFARRWIFQRAIRLGWTPELFGSFDRARRYGDRGRDAHKVERFGKKYQWIAYHELLARVADSYHLDVHSGERHPFDGLYQIHDRQIDPSLPPIAFESFVGDRGAATEVPIEAPSLPQPPLVDPNYAVYRGDIGQFNADEESLPIAERIVRITDEAGSAWVVLNGGFISRDKSEADDDLDTVVGLEQSCWVHSWLVPAASLTHTLEVVAGDIAHGSSSEPRRHPRPYRLLLSRRGQLAGDALLLPARRRSRNPGSRSDRHDARRV